MPKAPLPAASLPVRVGARRPTAKAIEKLQAKGPLPSGRPVLQEPALAQLVKEIHAHVSSEETKRRLTESIARIKATPVQVAKPGPPMPWNTYYTPENLAKEEAELARLPASLDFPLKAWQDLINQPNEYFLIKTIKDGYNSWASRLYKAHATQNKFPGDNYHFDDYTTAYMPELSSLWGLLVARAHRDAAADQLEFTPLLDLLWSMRDSDGGSYNYNHSKHNAPLAEGFPATLSCPNCEKILSSSADRSFVDRAMQFKSPSWRHLSIRHTKAFTDPDVILDCLGTFDEQGVKLLATNSALSTQATELLQEWALYQLAQGYHSALLPALLEGLQESGHPLTDQHFRRIHALLRFQKKTDLHFRLSRVPQIAKVPKIFAELMQDRNPNTWINLSKISKGPSWLSLVSHVASTDNLHAVQGLLADASPDQLEGLTRRSFLPWLKHDNKEIRLIIIKLIGSLPDGPAPVLPPLPPKRRRIR